MRRRSVLRWAGDFVGDHRTSRLPALLHAVLIAFFVALTAPVTTIFLMRAALFRERQKAVTPPPAHGPHRPPQVVSEDTEALSNR